jgi:hypothetical protein
MHFDYRIGSIAVGGAGDSMSGRICQLLGDLPARRSRLATLFCSVQPITEREKRQEIRTKSRNNFCPRRNHIFCKSRSRRRSTAQPPESICMFVCVILRARCTAHQPALRLRTYGGIYLPGGNCARRASTDAQAVGTTPSVARDSVIR